MINERTFKASNAHRLENPERLTWMPPGDVERTLGLSSGMNVADLGAGTGFFALPFARKIAPGGKLFAVDMQREMLDLIQAKLASGEPGNIDLIEGTADRTHLSDRICDLVFLANIWHEIDDHASALAEAARILRAGGRVAILDWRRDVSNPPGPPVEHRIRQGDVVATLEGHGWTIAHSGLVGSYSYLVVARKG